jgi:flagellin
MSLVVNTNVSSLTAQRSLAVAGKDMATAMERLSTGSKINSAADDAAGLAIAQRMTSQINGLTMAVKNANDGISLTSSVEGALVEVADMLQRLRELAIQSSNDTNTNTDRAFIQEEVNLLTAEISRVSSNTRFNNQLVLDGSFASKQLQVGTQGGETISLSVESVSSDKLGSYQIVGDRIEAQLGDGAGAVANITDATDDIIINGNSITKTIDVLASDSAQQVASKINTSSGETGVSAEAKTFALLSSEYATDQTYSVRINNKTTGSFVISNSNVVDAVDKINSISGSTGVTAKATTDNKVELYSSTGADISVENESALTALRVQSLGHDASAEFPGMNWSRAKADIAGGAGVQLGALNATTYTLVQKSTGLTNTFSVAATTTGEPTAQDIEDALNGITGISGFKVADISGNSTDVAVTAAEAFGSFEIYSGTDITVAANRQTFEGVAEHVEIATGNYPASGVTTAYTLDNTSTGKTYSFSVTGGADAAATAAAFVTAINAVDGLSGFSGYADATTATTMHLHGSADFGGFTLKTGGSAVTVVQNEAGDLDNYDVSLAAGGSSNDSASIQGTIALSSAKVFSVSQTAEESTVVTDLAVATGSLLNDNYFTTTSATLNTVSNVDLRTQAKANAAISVLDGAIEKISSMRADLGAVENRLSHTVSNLMNIGENTSAARSRILDADFSVESANLSKAQVLTQAGTAMLAQANAAPQQILQLLQ